MLRELQGKKNQQLCILRSTCTYLYNILRRVKHMHYLQGFLDLHLFDQTNKRD